MPYGWHTPTFARAHEAALKHLKTKDLERILAAQSATARRPFQPVATRVAAGYRLRVGLLDI